MTELHVLYALVCFYILIIFIYIYNIYINVKECKSYKNKRLQNVGSCDKVNSCDNCNSVSVCRDIRSL